MMTHQTYNVLFLCTGNSARSILAPGLMNQIGRGRLSAYSAGGIDRQGESAAIELLDTGASRTRARAAKKLGRVRETRRAADGFHPHGLRQRGRARSVPSGRGKPVTAHWGVPIPPPVEGTDEAKRARGAAAAMLRRRIELLVNLPVEKLDAMAIKAQLQRIGKASLGRRLAAEGIGTRRSCSRSSSARGSWASASPAGTWRSRCLQTALRPDAASPC